MLMSVAPFSDDEVAVDENDAFFKDAFGDEFEQPADEAIEKAKRMFLCRKQFSFFITSQGQQKEEISRCRRRRRRT